MKVVPSTPEPEARSDACASVRPGLYLGHEPGGLVLLVDDDPLLLRALRRILRADHQQIALASTPEEVEPVLHDPELAVVLLDLVMGQTDGLDILDRIKSERSEVEIIVMTGHASIESAVGCMRRGAFDYLSKPFEDVHRVRTTVRKALDRRRLVLRNRELEQAQETIVRQEKLAAVGRFAAEMVHEINNHLTVILGVNHTLLDRRQNDLEALRGLETQATTLAAIVSDMSWRRVSNMPVSSIGPGRMQLTRIPADPSSAAADRVRPRRAHLVAP